MLWGRHPALGNIVWMMLIKQNTFCLNTQQTTTGMSVNTCPHWKCDLIFSHSPLQVNITKNVGGPYFVASISESAILLEAQCPEQRWHWKVDVFWVLKILMTHGCSILFLHAEVFQVSTDVAQIWIKPAAENVNNIFVHQSPKDWELGLTEELHLIMPYLSCWCIGVSIIEHDYQWISCWRRSQTPSKGVMRERGDMP